MQLANLRCFNHHSRPAVARCPECRRYFCRECVVEHADRMICAHCLKDVTSHQSFKKRSLVSTILMLIISMFLIWSYFITLGTFVSTGAKNQKEKALKISGQ